MSNMAEQDNSIEFTVGVYRVLVGDTADLSGVRHRARCDALHEEFRRSDGVEVRDWGHTEDKEPHELVEIVVAFFGSPEVQVALASAVAWIGAKLAENAIDAAVSQGFQALARKIFRTQKAEQRVSDAWIQGPPGSPAVQLFPPEWGPGGKTVAAIVFSDGSRVEYHPAPGQWTGEPELEPSAERLSARPPSGGTS